MDRELEVIRGEMDATRESLTEKLGKLEDQVRETVSSAGESVTETIAEVKEVVAETVGGVKEAVSSVSDTVSGAVSTVSDSVSTATESVKEAFNLPRQVEAHPWAMFGAAVAVGCVGGYVLGGLSRRSSSTEAPTSSTPQTPATPYSPPASALSWSSQPSGEQKSSEPGLFDSIFGALRSNIQPNIVNDVVSGLEGLAVGSLAGVVRELVNQAAPEDWREGLNDMVGGLAQKLTGKRLEDLPSYTSQQKNADANGGQSASGSQSQHGSSASSSRVSAQL